MKVMLVDDEVLALQLLENKIKKLTDFKIVAQLTDGEEVVDKVRQHEPDIIFLDINIGHTNGLEIAEQINELFPNVKIIFVTAYAEHAITAFELNAIDYLLKPITKTRLLKTVEKFQKMNLISEKTPPPSEVTVKVYGQAEILNMNGDPIIFRTQKAKEMFFLLWHHADIGITRDEILESLWPDYHLDQAITLFHTTMYQLRNTFSNFHMQNPITYKGKKYRLTLKVYSDEQLLNEILNKEQVTNEDLIQIVNIYKGQYFNSETYPWSTNKAMEIDLKVKNYIITALKDIDLTKESLDLIKIRFFEEYMFEEDYVRLLFVKLEHLGKHKELNELELIVKQQWQEELGLKFTIQNN